MIILYKYVVYNKSHWNGNCFTVWRKENIYYRPYSHFSLMPDGKFRLNVVKNLTIYEWYANTFIHFDSLEDPSNLKRLGSHFSIPFEDDLACKH